MTTPQVKVCGITRVADGEHALALGANWLGTIVYPKSPRSVSDEEARLLCDAFPEGKRVVVDVNPTPERLEVYRAMGFDYFQLHFHADIDDAKITQWGDIVGPDRLWLVPKIEVGAAFPGRLFAYADTFVVDTYSANAYGGTGETGDWSAFKMYQEVSPEKNWILAGGLKPENICSALEQSGAQRIDVNSGVEVEPGIKDPAKLDQLFQQLKG